MRIFRGLIISIFALALAACGSGAGSISAYVTVSGASCVLRDAVGNTIVSGTSNNSQISFAALPLNTQPSWMSVACSGGSYLDDATGNKITLPSDAVQRAALYYSGLGTVDVTVTPLTEIAYLMTLNNPFSDYQYNLKQVAILLGLGNVDISTVQPTDVNVTSPSATTAGQYGIVLAVFSEMIKDASASYPDLPTLIRTFSTGISGGALGGSLKPDMQSALINYANNPRSNLVQKSLISTSSPLYANILAGTAVGTLSTQANNSSTWTIVANTTSQNYGLPITAIGGTPPYQYQYGSFAQYGTPPVGLAVNLQTGELNGMPILQGSYGFAVCAVDSVKASSCSLITLNVASSSANPTVQVIPILGM